METHVTPTTSFVEAISLKLNLHDFPLWMFFYDTFDYSFEKKLYEWISPIYFIKILSTLDKSFV